MLAGLAILEPACVFSKKTNASISKPQLPVELENDLENADEFTLFSITPQLDYEQKSTNTFEGHAILGGLKITNLTMKTSLIKALNDGLSENKNRRNVPGKIYKLPACFNPRHGIRAKKGDETVEFLICFQCAQIKVNSSKGKYWSLITSKEPAAVFNDVLVENGVPLPEN